MKLLTLFTKSEYIVGYRFSEKDIIDDCKTPYKTIPHSDNEWFADPFVYCHNGEYYVFMEVMMNGKGYAGIGYSKIVDGELTKPEVVIDYGKHLSFPFVFDFEGEIFIMPESCSEQKIKLFKCVEFPTKWEEYSFCEDKRAFYDTVLFEEKGRNYLFTSHPTTDLYGSKLYLMELEGKCTDLKIASEKVISEDYSNSRQAGKMLRRDGKLIRVAQDCSKNEYGRALEFLEVDSLDDYSEHLIRHIEPKDIKTETKIGGKTGIHTYNRVDNFEVIDLKLSKFYSKAFSIKMKMILDMVKAKIKS